jgi:purine-nucleoside phosphorylase
MQNMLRYIRDAAEFLQYKGIKNPQTGIILGTGLGELINMIEPLVEISYSEIPHFPVSTVEFHKGKLVYGKIGETLVLTMQGRFHYYEGYSLQEVTFPVRVMKELGVKNLLVSNAAGGMNPEFKKGHLVQITDHINMMPDNPLRGLSDPAYGPRFTDMSCPYHPQLNALMQGEAAKLGIELKTGVYVVVPGPNLETRAEYRFLRAAGADMVGMSTVPEIIVGNQCGLACAAVSVITDECDPETLRPVNIAEIIEVARRADKILSRLFANVVEKISTVGG